MNKISEMWQRINAEIAQLKAEQAKARADRKARLQTKIDTLNKNLKAKVEQVKQRAEQQEKEAKAKVKVLGKESRRCQGRSKGGH